MNDIGQDSPMAAEARAAAQVLPPGPWAVAVSGGADSVALLELLAERADLKLQVVHLDHETRAGESVRDAEFVSSLARARGLDVTIARRGEIEPFLADLPRNRSARFRRIRLELFRRVIEKNGLQGVVLAHHADDQAETILQRLLRGGAAAGLSGMSADSVVSGVRIVRPLRHVRRDALREMLRQCGIQWREDPSNALPNQMRNRIRNLLSNHPQFTPLVLDLGRSCAALTHWMRSVAAVLEDRFDIDRLCDQPHSLAMESARGWLSRRAGPGVEIPPRAIERLLQMAGDAATAPRQYFPGGVLVHRRGGMIESV